MAIIHKKITTSNEADEVRRARNLLTYFQKELDQRASQIPGAQRLFTNGFKTQNSSAAAHLNQSEELEEDEPISETLSLWISELIFAFQNFNSEGLSLQSESLKSCCKVDADKVNSEWDRLERHQKALVSITIQDFFVNARDIISSNLARLVHYSQRLQEHYVQNPVTHNPISSKEEHLTCQINKLKQIASKQLSVIENLSNDISMQITQSTKALNWMDETQLDFDVNGFAQADFAVEGASSVARAIQKGSSSKIDLGDCGQPMQSFNGDNDPDDELMSDDGSNEHQVVIDLPQESILNESLHKDNGGHKSYMRMDQNMAIAIANAQTTPQSEVNSSLMIDDSIKYFKGQYSRGKQQKDQNNQVNQLDQMKKTRNFLQLEIEDNRSYQSALYNRETEVQAIDPRSFTDIGVQCNLVKQELKLCENCGGIIQTGRGGLTQQLLRTTNKTGGNNTVRQSPTIAELLGKTNPNEKRSVVIAQDQLELSPDVKLKSLLAGVTNSLGQQTNTDMQNIIRDTMAQTKQDIVNQIKNSLYLQDTLTRQEFLQLKENQTKTDQLVQALQGFLQNETMQQKTELNTVKLNINTINQDALEDVRNQLKILNFRVSVCFTDSVKGVDDCTDLVFPSLHQLNTLRKDELANLRLVSVMNSNGGNYFASFETNNGWTSSACNHGRAVTPYEFNPIFVTKTLHVDEKFGSPRKAIDKDNQLPKQSLKKLLETSKQQSSQPNSNNEEEQEDAAATNRQEKAPKIDRVDLYYDEGASYLKGMSIRDASNNELQKIGMVNPTLNVKSIKLAHDEHIVGVRGKYSSKNYNSVFSNFQFITVRIAE